MSNQTTLDSRWEFIFGTYVMILVGSISFIIHCAVIAKTVLSSVQYGSVKLTISLWCAHHLLCIVGDIAERGYHALLIVTNQFGRAKIKTPEYAPCYALIALKSFFMTCIYGSTLVVVLERIHALRRLLSKFILQSNDKSSTPNDNGTWPIKANVLVVVIATVLSFLVFLEPAPAKTAAVCEPTIMFHPSSQYIFLGSNVLVESVILHFVIKMARLAQKALVLYHTSENAVNMTQRILVERSMKLQKVLLRCVSLKLAAFIISLLVIPETLLLSMGPDETVIMTLYQIYIFFSLSDIAGAAILLRGLFVTKIENPYTSGGQCPRNLTGTGTARGRRILVNEQDERMKRLVREWHTQLDRVQGAGARKGKRLQKTVSIQTIVINR